MKNISKAFRLLFCAAIVFVLPVRAVAATVSLPSGVSVDAQIFCDGTSDASDASGKLKLSYDTSKLTDFYDSESGASFASGTRILKSFSQTQSKKKTAPEGLWALLMFSVSRPDVVQKDLLKVERDGKCLMVTFVHRGVSYGIKTDDSGSVDLGSGFWYSRGAENAAGPEKAGSAPENAAGPEKAGSALENAAGPEKAGGAPENAPGPEKTPGTPEDVSDFQKNSVASEKVPVSPFEGLVLDAADTEAENFYTGKFKLKYDGKTLSVKGKIKLKAK